MSAADSINKEPSIQEQLDEFVRRKMQQNVALDQGDSSDPLDFTALYNTPLPPVAEDSFRRWAVKNGRGRDTKDYDLRGWWLDNSSPDSTSVDAMSPLVEPDLGAGHLTDAYKKPNHPTFSDESIYHGIDGLNGGTWEGDDRTGVTFKPGDANLSMRTAAELQKYFAEREPGAKLIMDNADAAAQPSGVDDTNSLSRLGAQLGSGANDGIAGAAGMLADAANSVLGGWNPLKAAVQSETARGIVDKALGEGNAVSGFLKPVAGDTGRLVEKPIGGSENIRENITALGAPAQQPRSALERITNSVGQQLGATVTTLGPELSVKSAIAIPGTLPTGAIGDAAQTLASSLPKGMVETLAATSPQRLAAVEAALATSAGIGGGTAREIAPDSYTAELTGQLIGALGPVAAYKVVSGLRTKMAGTWSDMRPSKAAMQDEVGRMITRSMDPDSDLGGLMKLDQSMQEARDLAVANPTETGIDKPLVRGLSLGQVTGKPSIIATERGGLASPGQFQDDWHTQQRGSREQVADFFDSIQHLPSDDVSIANTQDAMRQVIDAHAAEAARLARASVPIIPNVDPEVASTQLRDSLDSAVAQFRRQAGVLYDQVPSSIEMPHSALTREVIDQIENGPEMQDPKNVPAFVSRFYNEKVRPFTVSRDEPLALQKMGNQALREPALEKQSTSFGSLRNWRTQINDELRIELGRVDERRPQKVAALARLQNAAEDDINALEVRPDVPPDVIAKLRTAASFYSDGSQRFKRGLLNRVFIPEKTGTERIPAVKTFDAFFQPGMQGAVNADALLASGVNLTDAGWRPNPDVARLVRESALDSLARQATDVHGKVQADLVGRWRTRYQRFLSRFPNLDRETQTLQTLQQAMDARANQTQRSLEAMQRSAAGLMINDDPESAVKRLLGKNNSVMGARRLMAAIGPNQNAVMGLRRAVIDHIMSSNTSAQSGVENTYDFLHPGKLRRFMKTNRAVLSVIMTPEQMQNINRAQYAIDLVGRADKATMTGTDTAQRLANMSPQMTKTIAARGTTAKRTMRTMWNVLNAGVAPVVARTAGIPYGVMAATGMNSASRMMDKFFAQITEEEVRELWDRALIDPEVARMWAEHAYGASPAKTARLMHTYLAGLGVGYEHRYDEEKNRPLISPDSVRALRRDVVPVPPEPKAVPAPPPPKKFKPNPPPEVMADLRAGKLKPVDLADVAAMHQRDEIARRAAR